MSEVDGCRRLNALGASRLLIDAWMCRRFLVEKLLANKLPVWWVAQLGDGSSYEASWRH